MDTTPEILASGDGTTDSENSANTEITSLLFAVLVLWGGRLCDKLIEGISVSTFRVILVDWEIALPTKSVADTVPYRL